MASFQELWKRIQSLLEDELATRRKTTLAVHYPPTSFEAHTEVLCNSSFTDL
jgi:hypothetical protein